MDTLVLRLQRANEAYRAGKPLLMTDDEYDAALAQLEHMDATHPFLRQVRASPPETQQQKIVRMPFYLGSLDKAKVQDELEKWTKKSAGPYLIAEKLDGISGLWNPDKKKLYLSGDDNMGVDVSPWLRYISLSPSKLQKIPEGVWIRGELIMPRSLVPPGKLGRSIVNGQFHLKEPNPTESAKVRFVGYEIIGMAPDLTVQQQFAWLTSWGLWTPWLVQLTDISNSSSLSTLLLSRRNDSEYDMDGLVIRTNKPIVPRVLKGNPKDAIAWKPPNGETRLTQVIQVEWNASANGKLIPRVQIEPVHIGGSTINFVTGVNARRIVDWKIGPGASVIIRKGGDVIPLIESVEIPAEVVYPKVSWEWEGPSDTAVHIRQKAADSSTIVSQFMKMVKQLDWPNVGPAVMKSVVDAGYVTVPLLRKASEQDLQKLLGPIKGSNLFKLVQKDGWTKASEIDLFLACPLRPDGIGKVRLDVLLEVEPNVTRWASPGLLAPKGWSPDSLKEFQGIWKKYEEFRMKEWFFLPYPISKVVSETKTEILKGSVVFTGFRDAQLEASLLQKGYKLSDSVKSDTKAVFIADSENPQTYMTTKIEKAKKLPGCLILRKSDWTKL